MKSRRLPTQPQEVSLRGQVTWVPTVLPGPQTQLSFRRFFLDIRTIPECMAGAAGQASGRRVEGKVWTRSSEKKLVTGIISNQLNP